MKSKLIFTLLAWLSVSLVFAQSVVINKIYNSGVTSPAGQDDVIELLVIEHQLDMRGMVLKEFQGGSANNTSALFDAGAVRFNDVPFWNAIPAGTLIVLRRLPSDINYVQDTDATDRVLDLQIMDSDYLNYESLGGTFNITNYDMLMLKTGLSTGVDNAIHTVAFGIPENNTTYLSIQGPKMITNKISPTGGFLYPANTTITLSDFNGTDKLYSSTTTPIALTWGSGSGASNVAFVAKMRDMNNHYVRKSGNEVVNGNKAFTGNISIGTEDPKGYKLAVAGNMIAEEIKVKLQGNWPDYVFGENYRLQSLKELEHFIKKNKHLPGVPSEKEIKTTGAIAIGEMNKILLKKMEELTLYIIEQQKQIDQLLKITKAKK